ncbi:hypothetical protein RJ640_008742 [Escallonia rubra]|uniref:Uncharacterized protein n=1 Tax=Escallonia rubra TaxID=112253 RepID=A0AA88QQA0_9ASTE|nr:hypothetical protein RJ640_008742 [Escallonia rubra]
MCQKKLAVAAGDITKRRCFGASLGLVTSAQISRNGVARICLFHPLPCPESDYKRKTEPMVGKAKFMQKIVEDLDGKIPRFRLSIPRYLVGIDDQVQRISSWLQDGPPDVGILSIWGIGGIGKTTIA